MASTADLHALFAGNDEDGSATRRKTADADVAQDVFRSQRDLFAKLDAKGTEQMEAGLVPQLLLSVTGGSFMCFGSMLSMSLIEGVSGGPARILSAVGFLFGFLAVFVTGSLFFTEVNILVPQLLLNKYSRAVLKKQLRFWIIV